MLNVRPGQQWEVYSENADRWRPVRVVDILGNEVELRYLDMPGHSDLARILRAKRENMLTDARKYRLIADVP